MSRAPGARTPAAADPESIPPQKAVEPEQPPQEPRYRYIVGLGASGTLKPDWDQRFTVAIELEKNSRQSSRFQLGWNIHWSFRNWGVIKSVYEEIAADDIDAKYKAFGYIFGWISGTSMLGAGWQIRYARNEEAKGWASLGTRLVLFLDPIMGDTVDTSWSHALHGGVGYDFGKRGVGLRAAWAPDVVIFGSTDSAPLFLVMATIETLKWD